MSNRLRIGRAGRAAVLAVVFAFAAIPATSQAALSTVNLGTVAPFAVLGGQEVTNSGGSVLNGDLGVAPGTSLTGFQFATVNGVVHNDDQVANDAQFDLGVAYGVAAGQTPATDLTGQDLGGLNLTAGAWNYTSDAFLNGTVTFDAENNPDAQFVVQVGTQLNVGSGARVALAGNANPCNIYWQIGSSAVLDTTVAFQGNLMAAQSITLENGSSVIGRLLAQNGTVSLINNLIDGSQCGSNTVPPGGTPTGGTPSAGTPTAGPAPATGTAPATTPAARVTRLGRATLFPSAPGRPRAACTAGFRASVRGRMLKRVVFSLDGKRISTDTKSPFSAYVKAGPGRHNVKARVTFRDATRARTLTLRYRACASGVVTPRRGPSVFTG
jgi:hypothetical protein